MRPRPSWLFLAGSILPTTFATAQTAGPLFDDNAAAAIQDLATKAAQQNITVVLQPQGLVVNRRMIYYNGSGENIVGKSADEILTWSQRDLGDWDKRNSQHRELPPAAR